MDIHQFLSIINDNVRIDLRPVSTEKEEIYFFKALRQNELTPPIVRLGSNVRSDRFLVLEKMGKGPYRLLERHRDGKRTLASEYITQIAALAYLYYDCEFPSTHLRFEFNYKDHSVGRHWPMDIVVLKSPPAKELLMYAEVKTTERSLASLAEYVRKNNVPAMDCLDRGVSDGDHIRKMKYLWSTRVPLLWLVSPENVADPGTYFYHVVYDEKRRRIILERAGARELKVIVQMLGHTSQN